MLEYFQELQSIYTKFPSVKTYNLGIGAVSKTILVDPSTLQGQGSFVMEAKKGTIPLKIIDAAEMMQLIGMQGKVVDLLHVNCEGCEWELFDCLIQLDMLRFFKIIWAIHKFVYDQIESQS